MDYSNIIQYKQSGYIDLDTRQGGARIHRNSRDKQIKMEQYRRYMYMPKWTCSVTFQRGINRKIALDVRKNVRYNNLDI